MFMFIKPSAAKGVHWSQAQVLSSEMTTVRYAPLHHIECIRHKDVAAVRQRP